MNTLVMVLAVAACASAQVYPAAPIAFRVPSQDSAIIQSHRLGGNFAYSTHEAHAYGVQTPIIGTRTVPVGVSYVPGTPIVRSSTHYVSHKVPQVGYAHPQVLPYGAPINYAGAVPYGAPIPYAAPAHYGGAFPYPYAVAPAVAPAVEKKPVVDTA